MLNQLRKLLSRRRKKYISPLDDEEVKALSYPGQSVQAMIEKIADSATEDFAVLLMLFTATLQVWLAYRSDDVYTSVVFLSVVSFAFGVVLIPSNVIRWQKLRQLKQGRNGERIVAELLNQLIADGYTVFHDVPCGFKKGKEAKFNIDHILVGKKGIFVIETKTHSKRKWAQGKGEEKPQSRLDYDGQRITYHASGVPLKRNPVEQALRNAEWLEQELLKTTKQHFDVTPVVTFPGWRVDRTTPISPNKKEAIVLGTPTAKATRYMLLKGKDKLTDADTALIVSRIKMQIQDHRP